MSHVLTYPTHLPKTTSVAVIGDEFLHDLALADFTKGAHAIDTTSQSLSVLAQQTFHTATVVHLQHGSETLRASDIPTLGRLAKTYRLVMSGTCWNDVEVRDWWDKSSTRKIFDATAMHTRTARKLLTQWVEREGRLTPQRAQYVCEQVRYDPARAVTVARKAAVFDGGLDTSDLQLLAQDFLTGDFVEHLLQLRTREALAAAATLSPTQRKAALTQLSTSLGLLARINAAVVRFPHPTGETSRETRIPLPVLTKYWQVAGRYSPQEVLYKLDLLRYLTESSPRNYSSLVSLVAMW